MGGSEASGDADEHDLVRRVWHGHARRLAALDPLLPAPDDPAVYGAGRTVLRASAFDSEAIGVWERSEVDPATFAAAFGPRRQHRLRVWLDGPARADVMDALLQTWRSALAEQELRAADDPDTGAIIMWPARDVDGVASLVRHGFFCDHVLAVRLLSAPGRLDPAPVDGLTLRPARLADLDTVCALQMEALIYDDRLGGMRMRPGTERAVQSEQVVALSRNDGSRILAEHDGRVAGMAAISVASADGWLPPLVNGGPVGYVECLGVADGQRSRGIGQQLAAAAYHWAEGAGAELVMLHHAVVNPYSTRFWNAQGYRPLWIRWSAPLSRLLR